MTVSPASTASPVDADRSADHPLPERVLVANRGEIACRVVATLRRLGIASAVVHTPADAGARHVGLADVAVAISSYLDGAEIVAAALAAGADAVHPGYGFLAENAAFATACQAAGLVFVGPGPEAIAVMGDKIAAKASVVRRGVPTVPGLAEPGLDDAALLAGIEAVGYPALVKPSAGGGGKGMHVVERAEQAREAVAAARREAASSFGDDTLFVERYVADPRHVEVQVLADAHGGVVHLGERECSLQRRHQKVVEEAPSPLLDPATRARIGAAACETARSVGYRGAGTVEFIVSAAAPGEFFFMEMNTRLQVEHPVTEMVARVDLVEEQLRIAAGQPLTLAQDDVVLTGHAVEARVYAEDPARGFLPTGGRVLALVEPGGQGVRVDSALVPGLVVGSDYDPMLAKVIAWAPTRTEALARLDAALAGTAVVGLTTNVPFLRALLAAPEVVDGTMDTGLIERRAQELTAYGPPPDAAVLAALVMWALERRAAPPGPWSAVPGWRLGAHAPVRHDLEVPGRDGDLGGVVQLWGEPHDARAAREGEEPVAASVHLDGQRARVDLGGRARTLVWALESGPAGPGGAGAADPSDPAVTLHLVADGLAFSATRRQVRRGAAAAGEGLPELRSPMPGTVVAVPLADGTHVEAGATVVVVEAMKMEHALRAAAAGTVELRTGVGERVDLDQVLAVVRPDESDTEQEEPS